MKAKNASRVAAHPSTRTPPTRDRPLFWGPHRADMCGHASGSMQKRLWQPMKQPQQPPAVQRAPLPPVVDIEWNRACVRGIVTEVLVVCPAPLHAATLAFACHAASLMQPHAFLSVLVNPVPRPDAQATSPSLEKTPRPDPSCTRACYGFTPTFTSRCTRCATRSRSGSPSLSCSLRSSRCASAVRLVSVAAQPSPNAQHSPSHIPPCRVRAPVRELDDRGVPRHVRLPAGH